MMRLSVLLALLPAVLAAPKAMENPNTTLLTQTNSLGVVTGMPDIPALPTLPPLPTLVTIPAGFSEGQTTVWVAPSTYAVISVHKGTTDVLRNIVTSNLPGVPAPRITGSASRSGSGATETTTDTDTVTSRTTTGKKTGTTGSDSTASESGSSASTSSSSQGAPHGAVVAPGAVIGAAGLLLAWL